MVIKVTYLVDGAEKIYELIDVQRVQENLATKTLAVEINDTSKQNNSEILSEMINSTINLIELIDSDQVIKLSYYTRLNSVNRVYYDSSNDAHEKTLRLQFLTDDSLVSSRDS